MHPPSTTQPRLLSRQPRVPGDRQDQITINGATEDEPRRSVRDQSAQAIEEHMRAIPLLDVERQQQGRMLQCQAQLCGPKGVTSHAREDVNTLSVLPESSKMSRGGAVVVRLAQQLAK